MYALLDNITSRVVLAYVNADALAQAPQVVEAITDETALTQRGVKTLTTGGVLVATLDPAIVTAETAETARLAADAVTDTDQLTERRALITALMADRAALVDATQVFTILMLRPILARLIRCVLLVIWIQARRDKSQG